MKSELHLGEEATPNSGGLVEALQSVAYTYESALADIVDNSVTAYAKNVWIEVRNGRDEKGATGPYILIVDDGQGMEQIELVEAMHYATKSSDDVMNLGKFGLGMKTASLSQAHHMSVASRRTASGKLAIRAWDVDFLKSKKAKGEWRLLKPALSDLPARVSNMTKKSKGTTIYWTKLQRLIPDLKQLSPDDLDDRLNLLAESASAHLSLVFHRFLEGKGRVRSGERKHRITIRVNGIKLKPWDPFLRDHPKTKKDGVKDFTFSAGPERQVDLAFQAFILPKQDQFESNEEFRKAGLINKWLKSQGLYVYRLDRLIRAGGWQGLRANDEHMKLSRISVDLDRNADEILDLNLQKSRITLPAELRPKIKDWVGDRANRARNVYDNKPVGGGPRLSSSAGKVGSAKGASGAGTPGKSNPGKDGLPAPSKRPPAQNVVSVLEKLWAICDSQADRRALKRLVKRAYPSAEMPK